MVWDFKSWGDYKWFSLLGESLWVCKTNIYPLSAFPESLCPCETYRNIPSLKNPLLLQAKYTMTKRGFLPSFGDVKRRINLSFISQKKNSSYGSMFLIFHLINKHIWWEWKFQISNCILLLWRKLVSPNHSLSATMLRSRTWDRLAQGRRKVWCKTIFFQEGNWEAFAEWTGGVLGETRKKARIHTLAFSQPCLVDTTLGCQDTRWNTLDTDKARIKDFHHRHQNVLGGPQKGLLQEEKPEKWKARMQKSTASRNIMQITYTIKIFLITTL